MLVVCRTQSSNNTPSPFLYFICSLRHRFPLYFACWYKSSKIINNRRLHFSSVTQIYSSVRPSFSTELPFRKIRYYSNSNRIVIEIFDGQFLVYVIKHNKRRYIHLYWETFTDWEAQHQKDKEPESLSRINREQFLLWNVKLCFP